MCEAALSRFKRNKPIPIDKSTPKQGTVIYNELRDQQIASLLKPNNIIDDIYDWQSAPDESQWYRKHSVGSRTKQEWWKLKNRLDSGKPTTLVLIQVEGYFANPTLNHQVIAMGYEYDPTSRDLTIDVYDPNKPDTTQQLTMNIGLPNNRLYARNSSGKRLRGFFCNPNSD